MIDWFRTTLAHGLTEQGIDTSTISRVILAGGSSQWPFVADVVTEALGVERSRLMRSDRPYAVIAQGLSILPALQKKFDETREELRHDLPRFCRTQVRPLVEKVTDRYVAGVAADVTTELFDKIIRPILEEFRQKGGSVKNLRDSISGQVKANEAKLTEIIEGRMRTLRLGLPGELNELLREWFGSYGLSVGEKPLEEAQRTGGGAGPDPAEHAGPVRQHHGRGRLVRRRPGGHGRRGASAAAAVCTCWPPVPSAGSSAASSSPWSRSWPSATARPAPGNSPTPGTRRPGWRRAF